MLGARASKSPDPMRDVITALPVRPASAPAFCLTGSDAPGQQNLNRSMVTVRAFVAVHCAVCSWLDEVSPCRPRRGVVADIATLEPGRPDITDRSVARSMASSPTLAALSSASTQVTNNTHTDETTRAISIRSNTPPTAKDRNDSTRGGEPDRMWRINGDLGWRLQRFARARRVASLQPDWPPTRRGYASEWSVGSRSGSPVPPPRVARGGCERLRATRRTAWRSRMPDPVPL